MRTENERHHKWGFILREQELRRIAQSGAEHAAKLGASTARFEAKLKDGSLIESEELDDILTLENGGQKAVTRVRLEWTDRKERPEAAIAVQFEDARIMPQSWDSIVVSVVGESRDTVFVAAADLDDRVKKTRIRAWPYLLSRPWFIMVPLLIGLGLMLMVGATFPQTVPAIDSLEEEYLAGRITDPVEALIFYERAKTVPSARNYVISFGSFLLPSILFILFGAIVPRIVLSYVFYWGDAIARYDKRAGVAKIFWTVLVLGVLASLIAGLLLRFLE